MKSLVATLVMILATIGCEREDRQQTPPQPEPEISARETESKEPERADTAPPPQNVVTVRGSFGTRGRLPTHDGEPKTVDLPPEVVEALNSKAGERMNAIASRHGEGSVTVDLGGEGPDGLRMVVGRGDEQVEVHVPPATHPAEAVTNLDHTFDRALRELLAK